MRYPATIGLAAVLLFTLTACDDPQHGAWKVRSGIWMGWVLILVAVAGVALIVGAWLHSHRHRARRGLRTGTYQVYRGES